VVLEVLPESLDGIELRAMGRLKEQHDIFGKLKPLSGMKAPVIQLEHMELMGIVLGHLLEVELKAGAVTMGKLQQKALSRHRLHGAIEVKRFKASLHRPHGFSAGQCGPPARNSLQTKAALVQAPIPDRPGSLSIQCLQGFKPPRQFF
jgi:hypothetical protein